MQRNQPPSTKPGIPAALVLVAGALVDRDALDAKLLEDLLDCGASGDIADAVDHVLRSYPIDYDPDALRRHLASFGWLRTDLHDDDVNLRRTVWLLGSYLREGHDIVCLEE